MIVLLLNRIFELLLLLVLCIPVEINMGSTQAIRDSGYTVLQSHFIFDIIYLFIYF